MYVVLHDARGGKDLLLLIVRYNFFLRALKSNPISHILIAAAAAAKLLQSCPTLCNSIDGSPPGSSVPGILQARILEWVAISFSNILIEQPLSTTL